MMFKLFSSKHEFFLQFPKVACCGYQIIVAKYGISRSDLVHLLIEYGDKFDGKLPSINVVVVFILILMAYISNLRRYCAY